MRSRVQVLALLLVGPVLGAARPRWTPLVEDRLVVVVWAAACLAWLWLTAIGAVHVWATRTGRRRWRRLSGALLPAAVRRRVERLAVAGLLLAPVAACAPDGADTRAAPALILEETIPLAPALSTTTTGGRSTGSTTPAEPPPTQPWATAPDPSTATPAAPPRSGAFPTTAPPWNPAPVPGASTATPSTATPSTATPSTATPSTAAAASTAAASTVDLDSAAPLGPAAAVPPPPAEDQPDPGPDPLFPPVVDADARVVHRGESLWSIAADHVASDLGRRPSPAEVAPYWRRVVEDNRATLRSGNPDLIHPGEVVRLPPLRS